MTSDEQCHTHLLVAEIYGFPLENFTPISFWRNFESSTSQNGNSDASTLEYGQCFELSFQWKPSFQVMRISRSTTDARRLQFFDSIIDDEERCSSCTDTIRKECVDRTSDTG
ncbi:hypothetical protein L3Y34_002481 [Caenorhabditis briggsae]|uniref:Uncharacterized protein n=1 Tax=Caenorhabditis briggsae TaxID=6238 RepID=A0AAE9DFL5_CAEBR|nr:hypothetical protein L3Y34_002481 [Caenorhabditis briggsae]